MYNITIFLSTDNYSSICNFDLNPKIKAARLIGDVDEAQAGGLGDQVDELDAVFFVIIIAESQVDVFERSEAVRLIQSLHNLKRMLLAESVLVANFENF